MSNRHLNGKGTVLFKIKILKKMAKFSELIQSDNPTLVDVYATWCGPCQMMAPALEIVSKEMKDKAKVVKLDIDKNEAFAKKHNIRSVPTVMIYKSGKVVWKQAGAMTAPQMIQELNNFI